MFRVSAKAVTSWRQAQSVGHGLTILESHSRLNTETSLLASLRGGSTATARFSRDRQFGTAAILRNSLYQREYPQPSSSKQIVPLPTPTSMLGTTSSGFDKLQLRPHDSPLKTDGEDKPRVVNAPSRAQTHPQSFLNTLRLCFARWLRKIWKRQSPIPLNCEAISIQPCEQSLRPFDYAEEQSKIPKVWWYRGGTLQCCDSVQGSTAIEPKRFKEVVAMLEG